MFGPELNDAEVAELRAGMQAKGISLRCPVCANEQFAGHQRVSVNSMDARTKVGETLNKAVQVECTNCGLKLQFGGEVAKPFFQ